VTRKTPIDAAVKAAEGEEPGEGLATVAALRAKLEGLEALHVENAVRAGWSWRRIAELLGVSKQAVHKKYAHRVAERLAHEASSEHKRLVVTGRARQSVRYARAEAGSLGETAVHPEHLLLGLLRDEESQAAVALAASGVTFEVARPAVARLRGVEGRPAAAEERKADAPLPISPEARALLEESLREAVRRGDDHLGVEHLLLALLHDEHGPALHLLDALGVEPEQLERLLAEAE
jgi:hypothetical protein